MNGRILWKLALSALALLWAVQSIVPISDTPFPTYIREQVGADEAQFDQLMQQAQERVDAGQAPSVYVALGQLVTEQGIDLVKFFPDLNLQDVANQNRRNDLLLRVLLQRSQGKLRLGLDLAGGVSVTFQAKNLTGDEQARHTAMDQARKIIAERVDTLGVAEPVIRVKGDDSLEVQMPGVSTKDNPDIVETIGKPALLEFSVVNRTVTPENSPTPPIGYRRMTLEREDPRTGEITEQDLYVKTLPELTGKSVSEARPVVSQYGAYYVSINFSDDGAKRFGDLTTRMAQENERSNTVGRLAIILDGKLQSAPTVREPITGGRAQIMGNFTQRQAIDLANVLENPLEVGLEVAEMYEIGPSLATDARDASLMASIIGGSLVIAFMVLYYWGSGIVAVIAVLFNVLLVFGALAYLDATLTLPGVAALVLTIGMAVDANILILERVREELRSGKNAYTAVRMGFDKAFSTIVDANITTLITAALLAQLGTGPVKGFGVTLAIGIFGTLFCALIVSNWMMDLLVSKNWLKRVVGFEFFRSSNLQFLNYRKVAFMSSWTVVLLGVVATAAHWHTIWGVDFIGGDEVTFDYTQRISVEELNQVASTPIAQIQEYMQQAPADNQSLHDSFEAVIASSGFNEVTAVYQNVIGADTASIKVQTLPDEGPAFAYVLEQVYPDAGLDMTGVIHIGPSVGQEVGRSAMVSLALALLGILLYVALRFEWGFGVGAIIATIHDGLMTVGVYVFLGEFLGVGSGQFTAPMIASILMVLGYSINDTIVVFDRIREELDLNPAMSLKDVVHLAINRTLSRTLLTSLTTLLATLALFIFAAGVVVDFALVFMIGIFTGTFSSIFIASPVFYWYHKGDRRKVEEHHVLPTYDWHTEEGSKKA